MAKWFLCWRRTWLKYKLVIAIFAVIACVFLYLLAMDRLCDQGGENFIFGICQITDLLPFWFYPLIRHTVLLLFFITNYQLLIR
nr:PhoP/PhoQ regulator MgrB [Providencia stuartii]